MTASQELVAEIRAAFSDVRRPSPDQFSHCEQCDFWVERFLEHEVEEWWNVDPGDIAYECSALTALHPAGLRFLLPAYLTWYLTVDTKSSNTSENLFYVLNFRPKTDEHIEAGLLSLSRPQARAVKAFLEFELTNGDHREFARCAKEALESHWSQAGA